MDDVTGAGLWRGWQREVHVLPTFCLLSSPSDDSSQERRSARAMTTIPDVHEKSIYARHDGYVQACTFSLRERASDSHPRWGRRSDVHSQWNPIEKVRDFKYLGRILADDDTDTKCIAKNIHKARMWWRRVGKFFNGKDPMHGRWPDSIWPPSRQFSSTEQTCGVWQTWTWGNWTLSTNELPGIWPCSISLNIGTSFITRITTSSLRSVVFYQWRCTWHSAAVRFADI